MRDQGCVDCNRTLEVVTLNAAALSNHSLTVSLSSEVGSGMESDDSPIIIILRFLALVDSGSSHCFIDSKYVEDHNLPTKPIPPVQLRLLDGSAGSHISQSITLPVRFPSGNIISIDFYVTHLDSSCNIVLGYNWLSCCNPLIDWVKHSITFHSPLPGVSSPVSTSVASNATASNCADIPRPIPNPILTPASKPTLRSQWPPPPYEPIYSYPTIPSFSASVTPKISIISMATFVRACAEDGAQQYTLQPSAPSISRMASSTAPPDMTDVPVEYHDFADVFSDSLSKKLPEHRPYDLKINIEEGTSPPLGPIYSLSESELKALHEFIDDNLCSVFIMPSRSPHRAPVLFVKKKSGELRLCVNFRGLNKISKKDCYPLPLISDLLDSVRSAHIYTKLDLRHAYHLVCIAEGDEWKTAFRTRYGSFDWRVMPFGLTNAPVAFQRFVNDVFADMLDVSVVVYLNNILIYSNDPAEHRQHVREVLRRLRANGLYCKGSKCEFHRDSVEYLGYILSPEGLRMSEDKVKAILDWPMPRKGKDIQSFLGFANFYRRFIHEYSDIIIPLTCLTCKGTPWKFDNKCMAAFNELKQAFTHAPILTYWVPDRQLVVETDASDYAIATILSIYLEDGEIHPIAFLSRSLHNAKLNYNTHDKELLAIFEAFKYWCHYLEGSVDPIDVVTDHKNLEYFSTTKILTRWQVRWSEYLSQFNLVIWFQPGKLGGKPDALNRRWDVYPKEGDSQYAAVNPHNFRPVFTQEQLSASLHATFLEGPTLHASAIMDIDKLYSDIKQAQLSDSTATDGFHQAKSSTPTSSSRWSVDESDILRLDNRIYVPDSEDLHLRVLQNNHDHILAGHFGQNWTLELV